MAASSKRKYSKLLLKLKSILFNKDVLSFAIFLIIAAMFWFINTLNKEREFTVTIPIEYVNFPADLVFKQELPIEVKVKASDVGSTLWKYVNHKVQPIRVHFNENIYNTLSLNVSNTQLKTFIAEKLPPSTSIIFFSPSKIGSECERLYSKKVPVILNYDIDLKDQYMFCDSIDYFPRKIEIYGSENLLININEVYTKLLKVSNLSDSISKHIEIENIDEVSFSSSSVEVNLCAEMFTEKIINLPVQIINNPQNVKVLLFPQEVTATFNIGVKHFNSFNTHDIQVVFDYDDIAKDDGNKMKVKILNHVAYIDNVKVEPEEIDYLLEEKNLENLE